MIFCGYFLAELDFTVAVELDFFSDLSNNLYNQPIFIKQMYVKSCPEKDIFARPEKNLHLSLHYPFYYNCMSYGIFINKI